MPKDPFFLVIPLVLPFVDMPVSGVVGRTRAGTHPLVLFDSGKRCIKSGGEFCNYYAHADCTAKSTEFQSLTAFYSVAKSTSRIQKNGNIHKLEAGEVVFQRLQGAINARCDCAIDNIWLELMDQQERRGVAVRVKQVDYLWRDKLLSIRTNK